MEDTKFVQIFDIQFDGGTQSRVSIDEEIVAEYAEIYKANGTLPAPILFFDGAEYWLADGFHRILAAQKINLGGLDCVVNTGTRRDAILYAVGSNNEHGLRRTRKDKRKAVEMLLADDEWCAKSDRWITEQCRVSEHTVAEVRKSRASDDRPSERRVSKDGIVRPAKSKPKQSLPVSRKADPAIPPADVATIDKVVESIEGDGMTEFNAALERWARTVAGMIDSLPQSPWINEARRDILQSQLRSVSFTARAAKAHGRCPLCSGKGCKKCLQTGYMPKAEYDVACAER